MIVNILNDIQVYSHFGYLIVASFSMGRLIKIVTFIFLSSQHLKARFAFSRKSSTVNITLIQ